MFDSAIVYYFTPTLKKTTNRTPDFWAETPIVVSYTLKFSELTSRIF